MSTPQTTERRKFLRVRYANAVEHPRLKVLSEDFMLIDAGEHSVRFFCQHADRFRINEPVIGSLIFPGGLMMQVEGTVFRKDGDSVIIILRQNIPTEILLGIGAERRAYYRLQYTVADRPQLAHEDENWVVTEISEFGLRIRHNQADDFMPGQPVHAVLMFADGSQLEINGIVIRVEKDETAVVLREGIPGKIVMDEQRRVIARLKSAS